jgi:hypothetical protein
MSISCLGDGVKVLNDNPGVTIVTSYEEFFGNVTGLRKPTMSDRLEIVDTWRARLRLIRDGNRIGGPSGVMLRRKSVGDILFREDLKCAFDYELWFRHLHRGKLAIIPKTLYFTRNHSEQATTECAQGGFDREVREILNKIISKEIDANPILRKLAVRKRRHLNMAR